MRGIIWGLRGLSSAVYFATAAPLMALLFSGCVRERPFEITAAYQPTSGAYRQVELQANGLLPKGSDRAENGEVTAVVLTNDGRSFKLPAAVKGFDLIYGHSKLDHAAMLDWMRARGIDITAGDSAAEVSELLQQMVAAGKGAGNDLPPTKLLRRIRLTAKP